MTFFHYGLFADTASRKEGVYTVSMTIVRFRWDERASCASGRLSEPEGRVNAGAGANKRMRGAEIERVMEMVCTPSMRCPS